MITEKQDDATVSEIASRYSASELVEVIQELLEASCTNSCTTCIYARYCTVGLKAFDDKEQWR
jgi:hypothetical protein